ncbi:MAG: hypothetical protein ABJE66_17830 [Deltaproteobacteria bacterium]
MRIKLATMVVLGACSGGATVQFKMSNDTSTARTTSGAAASDDVLKLKLIAAYLAEDVDPTTMDNIGVTEMIWLNPQCGGDISSCNVSGFAGAADGPRITDYFDLARTNAEVNAELNSQAATIEPGSYRYARIEMCKAPPGSPLPTDPTLMWRGPGMTAEQPFTSGDCGRTSVAFDPPLVLAVGDSVAVTLGYDLATSIVSGTPAPGGYSIAGALSDGTPHYFRACEDVDADHRVCMDYPDFVPSAAKQ